MSRALAQGNDGGATIEVRDGLTICRVLTPHAFGLQPGTVEPPIPTQIATVEVHSLGGL